MKVIQRTCNLSIDLVKFTFKKKKKNILTVVILLKGALGITWQIMPIIMVIIDILNLPFISSIWTPEKHKRKKNAKLSISTKFVNVQLI